MKIEQAACPLETNTHANFSMAENVAYQCMENGGGVNLPTLTGLWFTVRVGYNVETKSRT